MSGPGPAPAPATATRGSLLAFAGLSASYFAHIGFLNPYLPLWLQSLGLPLITISLLTSVQSLTRVFARGMRNRFTLGPDTYARTARGCEKNLSPATGVGTVVGAYLTSPSADVGVVVRSAEEALDAIRAIRERGHPSVVVKEAFGTAGRNAIRLLTPQIPDAQRRWMERVMQDGREVVVEPWLELTLEKLDVKSPIEALLPVFDRGQVAIVTDGDRFLGLITRIDLLNYLRRRVQ